MGLAALADRSLFSRLETEAYLNHAAIAPLADPVVAAMEGVSEGLARRGVDVVMELFEIRTRLRASLAQLVNAPSPESIGIVANTTTGVIDVALCHPWQRGDRVVLTRGEFPANVTPWQRAAALFELEVVWLEAPTATTMEAWLEGLRRVLEEGAALVALSAVQFQTGLRMPLERIGPMCRDAGARLFVDAIQACGVVPVDVVAQGIDYLACGSHKWLMGPPGLAFVYVAPELGETLAPHVAGWTSHQEGTSFLFEGVGHLRYDRPFLPAPLSFEGGMPSFHGMAGLLASTEMLLGVGIGAIADHVDRYHQALAPQMVARGFEPLRAEDPTLRSGIASFRPPGDVTVPALHQALDARRVSCAIPDGVLRLSPHFPNAAGEHQGVLAALDEALAQLRG
ncbi:MAG: aminotransferase class V-fold PLP-dependent enzyme [Polyangiaceae bacterium]